MCVGVRVYLARVDICDLIYAFTNANFLLTFSLVNIQQHWIGTTETIFDGCWFYKAKGLRR